MPELRKDPIIGRWVIIATERAQTLREFNVMLVIPVLVAVLTRLPTFVQLVLVRVVVCVRLLRHPGLRITIVRLVMQDTH